MGLITGLPLPNTTPFVESLLYNTKFSRIYKSLGVMLYLKIFKSCHGASLQQAVHALCLLVVSLENPCPQCCHHWSTKLKTRNIPPSHIPPSHIIWTPRQPVPVFLVSLKSINTTPLIKTATTNDYSIQYLLQYINKTKKKIASFNNKNMLFTNIRP